MSLLIDPKNLPPNASWVTPVWLSCLSIEVWEMSPNWYWGVGVLALLGILGTAQRLRQAKYVDIFSSIESKK